MSKWSECAHTSGVWRVCARSGSCCIHTGRRRQRLTEGVSEAWCWRAVIVTTTNHILLWCCMNGLGICMRRSDWLTPPLALEKLRQHHASDTPSVKRWRRRKKVKTCQSWKLICVHHTCKLVAFLWNSPFWIKICHLCESSRSEEFFWGGGGGGGERERNCKLVDRSVFDQSPFLGSTWSSTAQTDRCMTSKHHESYREQRADAFKIRITLAALWCHTHTARSARSCFKSNTPHLTSWSSEPVRFDGTLTLTSACKHVVSVEVLHCEWSRHKVHNL